MSINKIIVPVDFSKHSEFAMEAAATLAKKYNASLLILHMLELSDSVSLTQTGNDNMAQAVFYLKLAEKRFDAFLDKDYLKDLNVTRIVKHFKVFSEVNEVANEHEADLIVMGSHGTGGVKELFVGSNTEKVVRHSDIPVLVVKHNPILMDFDNVVFACDFTEESIQAYLNACNLFNLLGSKMQMVYVNRPDASFKSTPEIEKIVANFFKIADQSLNKMKDVHYVSDYSVEKGVLNFSNVIGADLIAVVTRGRTGLSHFFEGSISEDIANHSTLPVMTFKM